jgi:hypothetical protein
MRAPQEMQRLGAKWDASSTDATRNEPVFSYGVTGYPRDIVDR